VAILITGVEKKLFSPVFSSVLKKEIVRNSDGTLSVSFAGQQLPYNPDFRLYLSTSSPLFLKGLY